MINIKEDLELNTLNHSCAHLLAHAVKHIYPQAKFWVGPVIDEGFYYDIDLGDISLTEEDLPKIEREMKKSRVGDMCEEFGRQRAEVIDRNKLELLINADLTIPQIAEQFPEYTYEQIYGTILCDKSLNTLYREHGQKKIVKHKK